MVERDGFEPSNSMRTDLQSVAFSLFATSPKKWCRNQDLNPEPTDYKSVALPIELFRHWCSHPDLNRNSFNRSRFWVCRVYQFRHGSNYKNYIKRKIKKQCYSLFSTYFDVYKSEFSSSSSTSSKISSIFGKSSIVLNPK